MNSLGVNRGVKKLSEKVTAPGRTLIITEVDRNKLEWADIPDGTLHVNPVTGALSVKVKGEATWVPVAVGGGGVIEISRDAIIKYEVYTITSPNNGDGTFSYKNAKNQQRSGYIDPADGWMIFDLEDGDYVTNRNKLDVIFDDDIINAQASGGVKEIDERRFKSRPVPAGTKLTVRYFQNFTASSLYPRMYVLDFEPPAKELGDLWMDTSPEENGTLTKGVLKWWNGTEWRYVSDERLDRRKNLSDLTDVPKARVNIGLAGDNNTTHYHDHRYFTKTELRDPAEAKGAKIQPEAIQQNASNRFVKDTQINDWQTHVDTKDANPHETKHDQLLERGTLDVTSGDATQNKHLSNAQGKKWEDHVNKTDGTNPHKTEHDKLVSIATLDPTSIDTTQNKHLSNAQAKKWEDHVGAVSPHSQHPIAPDSTRIFVQNTKPSGTAGDIWIDTSVSYGTK
jgi:hypothetical protein